MADSSRAFESLPVTPRKVVFYAALAAGLVLGLMPEPERVVGPDVSDKVLHAGGFLLFGLLVDAAYGIWTVRKKAGFLFCYGLLIEVLQLFVPGRSFSVLDILANTAGIAGYFLVARSVLAALADRRRVSH